jgi:hypothetical protein
VTPLRLATLLFLASVVALLGGCSEHHVAPTDACGLLTKSDVEKVLGVTVNGPIVEAARPMSISEGQVVQTLAGCTYTIDSFPDKPARVAIHSNAFRYRQMMDAYWEFSRFCGAEFAQARPVPGLGDEAWQGTALKLRKSNVELLIEVDNLPPNPPVHAISSSLPTRLYPDLQVKLARIAAGRL